MEFGPDAGLYFRADWTLVSEERRQFSGNALRVGDEIGERDVEQIDTGAFFEHFMDLLAMALFRFDEVEFSGVG